MEETKEENVATAEGVVQDDVYNAKIQQQKAAAAVLEAIKTAAKKALDDASKRDDNSMIVSKTTVTILKEVLGRHGLSAYYELIQIEDSQHEPTFRYRVSFRFKGISYTAVGVGRSKGVAKNAASRALLEQLIADCATTFKGDDTSDDLFNAAIGSVALKASEVGNKDNSNPISWIQELCMTQRWVLPVYELETEVGLPHERIFTVSCSMLNYRELGMAKSKRLAKRLAAQNMQHRLCGNLAEINENPRDAEHLDADLKSGKKSRNISRKSTKVSKSYEQLKNNKGGKLLQLQYTCLREKDLDYKVMMQEIADENNLVITYIEVDEKSHDDKFHCFLQVSTEPLGVFAGSGNSMEEAQRNAALMTLEHLKIVTR